MALLWTLTEAQEFLTLYTDAYKAIVSGKSYSINTGGTSRSLTRQDLEEIEAKMFYWKNYVRQLGESNPNRGNRIKFIKPKE
jgi:hypothetical protein